MSNLKLTEFARAFSRNRRAANISGRAMAKMCGVSHGSIYKTESGITSPTLNNVEKYSDVLRRLGVNVDEMMRFWWDESNRRADAAASSRKNAEKLHQPITLHTSKQQRAAGEKILQEVRRRADAAPVRVLVEFGESRGYSPSMTRSAIADLVAAGHLIRLGAKSGSKVVRPVDLSGPNFVAVWRENLHTGVVSWCSWHRLDSKAESSARFDVIPKNVQPFTNRNSAKKLIRELEIAGRRDGWGAFRYGVTEYQIAVEKTSERAAGGTLGAKQCA